MTLIDYSCRLLNNNVNIVDTTRGGELSISFHRTIRVPENVKPSHLPPSLGNFPLYKVKDYYGKLPTAMAAKGGLFMPMYQKEAMWIRFKSTVPFLIKIYSGGVNVISGEHYAESPATKLRRQTLKLEGKNLQDYVVAPEQLWLDGIASADGVVRQFVAMPMGFEYSVETQLTGQDSTGGLQFEITPALGLEHMINLSVRTLTGKSIALKGDPSCTVKDIKYTISIVERIPMDRQRLIYEHKHLEDERTLSSYGISKDTTIYLTLALQGGGKIISPPKSEKVEMNIAAGGKISQTIVKDRRPSTMWRRVPALTFNLQILNSATFKTVTGQAPPPTNISMQTYIDAGLPFFAMYEEPSDVSGNFEGLKSIGEIDKESESIIRPRTILLDRNGKRVESPSATQCCACCRIDDIDGILNGDGPLRGFRTVADIRRELEELTLISFN